MTCLLEIAIIKVILGHRHTEKEDEMKIVRYHSSDTEPAVLYSGVDAAEKMESMIAELVELGGKRVVLAPVTAVRMPGYTVSFWLS